MRHKRKILLAINGDCTEQNTVLYIVYALEIVTRYGFFYDISFERRAVAFTLDLEEHSIKTYTHHTL